MKKAGRLRAPRNPRIEALRLAAIVAIAIFHTFLPWFNSLAYGAQTGVDPARLAGSPLALTVLGLASLLGTMGNHIFYMISGFFLLPSMIRQARTGASGSQVDSQVNGPPARGYWSGQYRRVGRKALAVLVSVALYTLICGLVELLMSRLLPDTPVTAVSTHQLSWLLGGLEFIWVYLLLLVLAPIIGWLQARWRGWTALVPVLFFLVTLLNLYVSFFSQGSTARGLLDWRKLMSAATYLVGFLLAGLIGQFRERFLRLGSVPLVCSAVLALVVVITLASSLDSVVLGEVSFKSTSLVSFLLAISALLAAAKPAKPHASATAGDPAANAGDPADPAPAEPTGWRLTRWLASGILGFYILQSLLFPLWSGATQRVLQAIVGTTGSTGPAVTALAPSVAAPAGTVLLFSLVGLLVSLVFVLLLLVLDRLVRQPLLRALKLV